MHFIAYLFLLPCDKALNCIQCPLLSCSHQLYKHQPRYNKNYTIIMQIVYLIIITGVRGSLLRRAVKLAIAIYRSSLRDHFDSSISSLHFLTSFFSKWYKVSIIIIETEQHNKNNFYHINSCSCVGIPTIACVTLQHLLIAKIIDQFDWAGTENSHHFNQLLCKQNLIWFQFNDICVKLCQRFYCISVLYIM